MNRKNREVFLDGDVGDEYEVRLWNDEEFYTLYIDDIPYKISFTIIDEQDILIFNYETEEEVLLNKNESIEINSERTNKNILLKTHEMSVDILTIQYIS